MRRRLLTHLVAYFVGFLVSLIVLALFFLLGAGILATILYWGNFEGMRERVSLGEIWAEVGSPKTILAFWEKAYPWGLFWWLAGGVLAGGLSAVVPSKRGQTLSLLAVSVLTGLGVSTAIIDTSFNPSVIVVILLGTIPIVPAFFVAVALSRRLPRFYEWLRDTEVESLFRR